jgi:hypothetical protein
MFIYREEILVWKEEVRIHFKILLRHSPGETDKNRGRSE